MMNEEAEESERLSNLDSKGRPKASAPAVAPAEPDSNGQRVVHNTPTDADIEAWGVTIRKG